MATFDPSVIAQIGQNTPNLPAAITQGKSDAVTLQGMMDTNQLNKMKLNQAQQDQARQQKLRDTLASKDIDLSKPGGFTTAAERLSRQGLGPEAMDLIKTGQGIQQGQAALTIDQLKLYDAHEEVLGGAAAGLVGRYKDLIQGGTSPALAAMIMQPEYQRQLKALSDAKLPDGSPVLNQQDLSAIRSHPTFDPSFVQAIAGRSVQSRAMLKQQLDAANIQSQIHSRNVRDQAIKEGKLVPVEDPNTGNVVYMPSSQAGGHNVGKPGELKMTPQATELASQMATHDIPFPSGLGFSAALRIPILNKMAQDGVTWEDVRKNGFQYYMTKQELNVVGRMNARIRSAEIAITSKGGFADQVLDASKNVDFNSFKVAAAAQGWKLDQIQDPQYQTLKTALLGLAADYAAVLARGGNNVSSQEAARQLFSGTTSFAAMKAKVKQAVREMHTTQGATQQTADELINQTTPREPPQGGTTPQAGTTPPPPAQNAAGKLPSTKQVKGQQWTLKKDKNGNRAYVSPDGKQFQEVQ